MALPDSPIHFGHRQVWQIALPLVISNITVPLLGLVDTIVVGHLSSPHYLAAVAVGATIFSVLFLGFNFLRMGTTGLTAQAFGRNDTPELQRVLMRSAIIALVIAGLLFIFQHPIVVVAIKLIGADPDVSGIARDYFHIRIFAAPASLLNIVFIGWFIGLQNARVPLYLMLLINITNIVLDLLFVTHLGYKANGVALASVIAEYCGCVAGIVLAWRYLRTQQRQSLFDGIWHLGKFTALMSLNFDLLIRTLALQFSFAFLTAMGARQGSAILAANAILLNFQHLMSYALDGFANAAEALVGRAIGAQQALALKEAVKLTRFWSWLIALALALLFALFGRELINVMTSIDNVRALAVQFLPWIIISPLISVWCFLYDGVFVGAVLSRQMRNIMLISTLAVFLPAYYLLQNIGEDGFGNHGLWAAFLLFMAARGVFMHVKWQQVGMHTLQPHKDTV